MESRRRSRRPRTWATATVMLSLGVPARGQTPPVTAPHPDFAAAVRVLDLDRSVAFAERSRRMLDALLADDDRLEQAVEPLVKGEEGKLYVRGEAPTDAPTPALDWLDELGDPPPRELADFVLRAEARSEREVRNARLSFRSVVGLSPADAVALAQGVLGQLDGSDAEILAAYRRDLPRIAAWSAQIVDLSRARVLAPSAAPDYTTLAIEAPLDEDALDERYPTLGKLLSWAREIHWRITDERGRVLALASFDGDERTFRVQEWKRGNQLLWSDGASPLRDADGALVPVELDLAREATYRVELSARAVLVKLGGLRVGSFALPSSDLELRYLGADGGRRADWELRIRSISDAPALVEWMLPLTKLRESLVRTFQVSLVSAPTAHAPALHDMGLVAGSDLPRSAALDFAQSMARWATDSFSLGDLLRAGRDFAAAAEQDLSALRRQSVARADVPSP